ncbi:response regulator [Halomonas saccharevitans]|uniref:Response regulator n=1 Tax=Halomonas saccharevitans TaxID=416872 RepID=A0ABU3NGV4_9GAMM|nr:response regulator [Halomonas saccharevitans]MDT8879773.1 response regulator [Halomonas saccharevitans]
MDRLWSRLVWPIFWPLLLVQVALVVLCLLVGLLLWWMMPTHASWNTAFWLPVALLLGSCLNVAVFLTLLRQRMRGIQREVDEALAGVETYLARHHRPQRQDQPLSQRLWALSSACEDLVEGWRDDLGQSHATERRLVDDLAAFKDQVERLEAGRVRAREESRLKSGYLGHLRQSLSPLMTSLTEVLESETLRQRGGEHDRGALLALRERLADAMLLLENLDASADTPAPPAPPGAAAGGRVLIVDDGPVNLTLARQVLERQGLEVATATSGEQAMERLEEDAFDLVLMDIFMPGMDGVEASRCWREREAEMVSRRRSVLVALTANASDEDRRRFKEAGMDDFLAKPYRPQALVDMVRQWLVLPEPDPS